MIETLTAEQEAQMAVYRDRYLAYGLSTEAADRETAERGLRLAYQAAGLEPPRTVIWLRSPREGVLASHMLSQVLAQVGAQVRDQVLDQVWDQVWDQVLDQVGAQVGAQVRDSVWGSVWDSVLAQVRAQVWDQAWGSVWDSVYRCGYGQHDAPWIAWCRFFGEVCGVSGVERLEGIRLLTESCGWWWPFEGAAILTERPHTLHRDDQGRLHCDTGPAIQYPDGWGLWAIHGVRVPQQVVEAPDTLTPQQITDERNAEVRRIMLDRFGWERYLRECGAEPVHRDDFGTLYRVEFEDDEPLVEVHVVNGTAEDDGTYHEFFLRCDPQLRPMKRGKPSGAPQRLTALNAVASTYGMTGEEYAAGLVVRT